MAKEIERKYLVDRSKIKLENGVRIAQGYLSTDPEKTIRVRTKGDKAFLTIKGKTSGIQRAEYEYEIPTPDANELLLLCGNKLIDKTRYLIFYDGKNWEVDDFHGRNAGLLLAEIELEDESERFGLPAWVEKEVSHDRRFFNSYLSEHPFVSWEENADQ